MKTTTHRTRGGRSLNQHERLTHCVAAVCCSLLLVACQTPTAPGILILKRPPAPPTPVTPLPPLPAPAPPSGGILTGVIKEGGDRIVGATVEAVTGSSSRGAVTTDAEGRYSLPLDAGDVRIRVTNAGYFSEIRDLSINGDRTRDFHLQRIVTVAAGSTVTGSVSGYGTPDHPTCFGPGPDGYEDVCRKFLFIPVADGTLDVLNRSRSVWMAIDLMAPDGISNLVLGGGRRVTMSVHAGLAYEIRVINFDATGDFELQVGMRQ